MKIPRIILWITQINIMIIVSSCMPQIGTNTIKEERIPNNYAEQTSILTQTITLFPLETATENATPNAENTTTQKSILRYYWPDSIPDEYKLNKSNSYSDNFGYLLEYDNLSMGFSIRILGGSEAAKYVFCEGKSQSVIIRGYDGCFSQTTGAGYGVEWKEQDIQYSVGGMGVSKTLALEIAENLHPLEINTWNERLSSE